MQHKDACPILPSGWIESIDVVFPYGGLAHETFCLDGLGQTRGNGKRVVESRKLKVFFLWSFILYVCWRSTKKHLLCISGGGVLGRLEVEKNIFCSCWVFAFKLWWCPAMMNLGFQYLHVFTYRYPPNFPNVDRYAMHLSGPGCYWNKIITIILLRWRLISLLFVVVLTIYLRCKFPKKTMQN